MIGPLFTEWEKCPDPRESRGRHQHRLFMVTSRDHKEQITRTRHQSWGLPLRNVLRMHKWINDELASCFMLIYFHRGNSGLGEDCCHREGRDTMDCTNRGKLFCSSNKTHNWDESQECHFIIMKTRTRRRTNYKLNQFYLKHFTAISQTFLNLSLLLLIQFSWIYFTYSFIFLSYFFYIYTHGLIYYMYHINSVYFFTVLMSDFGNLDTHVLSLTSSNKILDSLSSKTSMVLQLYTKSEEQGGEKRVQTLQSLCKRSVLVGLTVFGKLQKLLHTTPRFLILEMSRGMGFHFHLIFSRLLFLLLLLWITL